MTIGQKETGNSAREQSMTMEESGVMGNSGVQNMMAVSPMGGAQGYAQQNAQTRPVGLLTMNEKEIHHYRKDLLNDNEMRKNYNQYQNQPTVYNNNDPMAAQA